MPLNQAIIMGRITRDLEVKRTPNGNAVLSFTVAVDRYVKDGEKQADFISCVAWNKTAEFIAKYFGKGRMIAVTGNLHSRTFDDKNGVKHYVTEVYVDSADFTGEKRDTTQNAQNGAYSGGYQQGQSYPTPQQNAPQAGAQSAQNAQAARPVPDTSADFADFEVFSEDGVPF